MIHVGEGEGGAPPPVTIQSLAHQDGPDLWRERVPRLRWGVSVGAARIANVLVERGQPVPVQHDKAWMLLFVIIDGEVQDPRLSMVVRAGEAILTGRLSPPNLSARRRSRVAAIALPWICLPERTIRAVPERSPTLLWHARSDLEQLAHIGRNARGIGTVLGCFGFKPIEDGVETTIRTLVCNALRIEGLPGLHRSSV